MDNNKSDRLGVVWVNVKKDGTKYLTITIDEDIKAGAKLVAFQSPKKLDRPDNKSPDFHIFESRPPTKNTPKPTERRSSVL